MKSAHISADDDSVEDSEVGNCKRRTRKEAILVRTKFCACRCNAYTKGRGHTVNAISLLTNPEDATGTLVRSG